MRILLIIAVSLFISSITFADDKTANNQVMEEKKQATALAFATLSEKLGADKNDLTLIHIARFNWPDSSLGCPEPGMNYSQAIVPGYLALLKHGVSQYRVHIGGDRGLVCDLTRMPLKLDEAILDNLKNMAIADLAGKLATEAKNITVIEDETMVWPDTNFGCSTGSESAASKSIRGYLLKLEYRGRTFEYRTSRYQVKACPAIEAE